MIGNLIHGLLLNDYLMIISIFLLLILNINVIINTTIGPFLRKAKKSQEFPFVSVLIPARNEENNIRKVIKSLMKQNYPNFEIIVLNDNSTDNTLKITMDIVNSNQLINIKVIDGKTLPTGWLGKNWACFQLFENSQGEILIFTDADNSYSEDAISKTVGMMQEYNLDLFSAFPQQITTSFWEKLIIPVIDLIIYSGLILKTTLTIPLSIFSAANGQWIAVNRGSYSRIGTHKAVKDNIVEDVALSRLFKKSNFRTLTGAGTGIVYGKMYNNGREIWNGLSKNLFGLTNFKTIPFFFFLIIAFLSAVLPFVLLVIGYFSSFIMIAISLNFLWRFMLSISFKHNLIISIFLHPVSIVVIIIIGINSYFRSKYGTLKWKDREIKIEKKF